MPSAGSYSNNCIAQDSTKILSVSRKKVEENYLVLLENVYKMTITYQMRLIQDV